MSLNDWYKSIQRDIDAWRRYREIDDKQEKDIKTLERWLDIAKQSKPLWLKYRIRSAYYLRLAKSAERKSYTRPTYRPKVTHLRRLNTVMGKHFDRSYIRGVHPFLTKCKPTHIKSGRQYARIKMGKYHIDTTGFDFDVKYAKRDMTEYEPKLNSYELDRLYATVTVRKMRKRWGGVSRVLDDSLLSKVIYDERYAHRDLNRLGRKIATHIDKSRLKEQTLRSVSHTLIRVDMTTIESVQLIVAEGLKDQYEKAVRKEIEKQTSKSSATVDAWDEFGNSDISSMTDDIDWTDLKAVLRKFATIVKDTKDFIANAWEDYGEEALKNRLASPNSKAKMLSADDISDLDNADKGYMDPNY